MARLIPSFMDDNTAPGERDVFNMLAAGPADWTALHSLDLAPWNRGLRTEIDFVIVVPDQGIVCVEVKSHDDLSFDGERWYPPQIKRSPFKQAADARHTFYRRLSEVAPQFRHVPVVHCCIFPRSPFDLVPNLSVQPWELIDARAFRKFTESAEFCADLRDRIMKSVAADRNLRPMPMVLSAGQVEEIVRACVPVQRRRPSAREEIVKREEQVEKILRDQQKPVLQLAALNKRLVVDGGAGTGKTLIAMEVAHRAAERGCRTALLAFNQLVGNWMRERVSQTKPVLPNLIVGRAIQVLAEMTGIQIPEHPTPEFWETELPQRLEERLTDPDFKAIASFDYVALDEAQDILARPHLWQCICQFVSAGIGNGSFALFGDFEHQVLAQREAMQRALTELENRARPVRWRLSENCRNYRIVGDTAVRLGGLDGPVYSGYLRAGGGVHNYDIFFYDSERAQLDQLRQWLNEFKMEGYRPSEITLLSFRADPFSAAAQLKAAGFKLRPAWQSGHETSYTTVHAFKGMENKVVILTDVALSDQDFHRDLFYTGMTRATESIRVLCDNRSQDTLLKWLAGRSDR